MLTNARQHSTTRTSVNVALDTSVNTAPFSFRLPRPGQRDPHFGLSRSGWNELILSCAANGEKPPVKSFVRSKPGKIRGCRFILYEAARLYFERLAKEQCPKRGGLL